MVTARIEFEVSFDDRGPPSSEHTTATVQLSATASFDSAEQRFADVDVSLPSAETVDEPVELVVAVDPSLALRTAMFPEFAERLRQAAFSGARSDRERPDNISEGPMTETSGQDYDPDQDGDG